MAIKPTGPAGAQQLAFNFETNAARNATTNAATSNKDVKKAVEKETGSERLESQSSVHSTTSEGITTRELGGKTTHETDSGVRMTTSEDGTFDLSLPTGHRIASDSEGRLTGLDSEGKQFKPELHDDGEFASVGFVDKKGNFVEVGLDSLDFAITSKHDNFTQHVFPDGTQVLNMSGTLQSGPGKFENIEHAVKISPEGEVQTKGKIPGFGIQDGEVSFDLKEGLSTTRQLMFPLPGAGAPRARRPKPQHQAAPNHHETPRPHHEQKAEPKKADEGGPILQEEFPPFGLGEINESNTGNRSNTGTQRPPQPEVMHQDTTPSGVTRVAMSDGTNITQLLNGVQLTTGPNGTAAYDGTGQPLKVQEKTWQRPGQEPETQYLFADSRGNHYSMFSNSLDFTVESPNRDVAQVVRPDGRVMTAVRDGHTTHYSEVNPVIGQQNGSPGVFVNYEQPDRMYIQGSQRPVVQLPYAIPTQGGPAPTPDLHAGESGYIPNAFGWNQAQNQGSFTNNPGELQQGIKPSMWQRIKSAFGFGDPQPMGPGMGHMGPMGPGMGPMGPGQMDPRYYQAGGQPPPGMGPMPGGYYDPMMGQGQAGYMDPGMMAQMRQMEQMNKMTQGMMMVSMLSTAVMPFMMFLSGPAMPLMI